MGVFRGGGGRLHGGPGENPALPRLARNAHLAAVGGSAVFQGGSRCGWGEALSHRWVSTSARRWDGAARLGVGPLTPSCSAPPHLWGGQGFCRCLSLTHRTIPTIPPEAGPHQDPSPQPSGPECSLQGCPRVTPQSPKVGEAQSLKCSCWGTKPAWPSGSLHGPPLTLVTRLKLTQSSEARW